MDIEQVKTTHKQAAVVVAVYSVTTLLFLFGLFNDANSWWPRALLHLFCASLILQLVNAVTIARLVSAHGGNGGMAALNAFFVGPFSIATFATQSAKARAAIKSAP